MKAHEYIKAVNSSQAFAFNLFFPFRLHPSAGLSVLLGRQVGRSVAITDVRFEYRHEMDLLGEWQGDDPGGAPHTASDVGVLVRDEESGERGIVLLEVKLSEENFTRCQAAKSGANKATDLCESADKFFASPERCYEIRTRHSVKDRRYWEIFRRAVGGDLRDAFSNYRELECPFVGDSQQIMRNHALALALVKDAGFAFSAFGLVHHDLNPDVVPAWDRYCKMTSLPGLFRWPATAVLDAAPGEGWWPDWRRYVRERYGLGKSGNESLYS